MKISSGCTAIWYNLPISLQAKTYMFNLKEKIMWIIVAVILILVFSGALDKASKKTKWTEDDDLTCQLDEDLDD